MAESLSVDKSLSIDEQYELFIKQVKSLLDRNDNWISNLSNLSAALKQSFAKISWAGFYLFDGIKLYLGPFQGNIACTGIELNKGVCGTAAALRESIVVPDVDKFPGHIACDPDSRSEIVVPLVKDGNLLGVLDVDSTELNSFNDIDKRYLIELCKFLVDEILK